MLICTPNKTDSDDKHHTFCCPHSAWGSECYTIFASTDHVTMSKTKKRQKKIPCLCPHDNPPFIWAGQTEIIRGRVITSRWREECSLPLEQVFFNVCELSCWLCWVFKKWFTLLNVWPTFPSTTTPPCPQCVCFMQRWGNKHHQMARQEVWVCSVLHSSLHCIDCLTYTA